MKHRSLARQSGFTLVEIAIVLVIIGLLLGGVLKGQELIENARIKSIVNDMKAVQAAHNGYLDRYRLLPGDDTNVAMNNRGWAGAGFGGDGDGILEVTGAQTFANGGESRSYWRGLRASLLLAGDPVGAAGAAGLPRHGGGGLLGIATGTIYGQTGTFVCASDLPTKQAAGVDTLIDGTLPATQIGNNIGTLLGATGAAALPPAAGVAGVAYAETLATNWTVCMRI
jgi:prepilin-type N-terminal cleavage/methylation domain-containing protein